jgi:hypothetical protein
LHQLITCYARKCRELWRNDVSVMPGWILTSLQMRPSIPWDAVVEAETRPAHAPAAERNTRRQR